MVVSAREEASEIAVAIMKKGGNAFDAMVATELALVCYPQAGNMAEVVLWSRKKLMEKLGP
jgi:gamma-glutamyltranspeptidase/glutathione hydrolase